MLTTCSLLCVLVSAALVSAWRTIFWTTGALWQFCGASIGKSAENDCRHGWRWISIGAMLCAFKNFITDRTSQLAGTGVRPLIFNRCNDAIVRTREVLLMYASCDDITLITYTHAITSSNKWFTSCRTSGKLYFWTPLVHHQRTTKLPTFILVMRKVTRSYRSYSIPDKTAALVPEFAVEGLPSAELQPSSCTCSEWPALRQNTMMVILYKVHIIHAELRKLVLSFLRGSRSSID